MKKLTDEALQKAFRKAHKACYGCGPDGWTAQYKRDVKVFRQGVKAAQHSCGAKFFLAGFNAATRATMQAMVFSLRGKPTAQQQKALEDVARAAAIAAEKAGRKGRGKS